MKGEIIVFCILLCLLLGGMLLSIVMSAKAYSLEDFSCEDINKALMSGHSLPSNCNRLACRAYTLDDLYVHYKFRCEKEK